MKDDKERILGEFEDKLDSEKVTFIIRYIDILKLFNHLFIIRIRS